MALFFEVLGFSGIASAGTFLSSGLGGAAGSLSFHASPSVDLPHATIPPPRWVKVARVAWVAWVATVKSTDES